MLKEKLLDPAAGVLLYGTTPPREGTGEEAVRLAAEKLAARLSALPLDGVVVYDIQDEAGRTAVPRPFAFTGTIDPRRYARLLAERMKFLDTLHADMKTSMQHDLEAGKPLEAPWLCGAVARMSAELGLDAPVNRTLYAALKPFLNGPRRPAA